VTRSKTTRPLTGVYDFIADGAISKAAEAVPVYDFSDASPTDRLFALPRGRDDVDYDSIESEHRRSFESGLADSGRAR
jgi:hypothetical protein